LGGVVVDVGVLVLGRPRPPGSRRATPTPPAPRDRKGPGPASPPRPAQLQGQPPRQPPLPTPPSSETPPGRPPATDKAHYGDGGTGPPPTARVLHPPIGQASYAPPLAGRRAPKPRLVAPSAFLTIRVEILLFRATVWYITPLS